MKNKAQIFHFDLYGKREVKYDFLTENSLKSIEWTKLNPQEPELFFVPKDFDTKSIYDLGFSVNQIFPLNNVGIVTARDEFTIHNTEQEVANTITEFLKLEDEKARVKFRLGKDVRDWQVNFARKDLLKHFPDKGEFTKLAYRPFDIRWTYYTGKTKGFHCYPRNEVMQHFLLGDNVGLVFKLGNPELNSVSGMLTKYIIDFRSWSRPGMQGGDYIAPLYLYPDANKKGAEEQEAMDYGASEAKEATTPSDCVCHPSTGGEHKLRVPNLNMEIVKQIAEKLGLRFVPEKLGLRFVPEKFPSCGGVDCEARRGGLYSGNESDTITNISTPKRNTINYMNLPYNPKLQARAKELRKAGNLAEVLFWNQIKNKNFKGLDFDRQKIIGNYIVDFFCANHQLVIEIDGSSHDERQEYDAERDSYLEGLGLVIIRILDKDVKNNMDGVLKMLENHKVFQVNELETTPSAKAATPPQDGNFDNTFAPIDILDYIYAVLHSPTYREKYKEFLKIDFPRVPYPKDKDTFWKLVKLGGEIRQIHLLESPIVEQYITQYPIDGDNVVIKPRFTNSPPVEGWIAKQDGVVGRVYINDTQYFDNVPQVAWEFYIGGYQPAQKWLKDRKDRKLEFDDILHYQKIIVALTETDRLMKEIDKIGVE